MSNYVRCGFFLVFRCAILYQIQSVSITITKNPSLHQTASRILQSPNKLPAVNYSEIKQSTESDRRILCFHGPLTSPTGTNPSPTEGTQLGAVIAAPKEWHTSSPCCLHLTV